MNSRKKFQRELASLCSELSQEDGMDPREFFQKQSGSKVNYKNYQLCKQVERALNQAFSFLDTDSVLSELQVLHVRPAPDSSNLLVVVCPVTAGRQLNRRAVIESIARHGQAFRFEIAGAIHRKKVPQLVFQYVCFD